MGERADDPSMDELRITARRWGSDPVHPEEEAYELMAEGLSDELEKSPSIYTNSASQQDGTARKRPSIHPAELRQPWVTGCSATLHRTDGPGRGRGGLVPSQGRGQGWFPPRGLLGGTRGANGGKGG